jgi:hypothetical protein
VSSVGIHGRISEDMFWNLGWMRRKDGYLLYQSELGNGMYIEIILCVPGEDYVFIKLMTCALSYSVMFVMAIFMTT